MNCFSEQFSHVLKEPVSIPGLARSFDQTVAYCPPDDSSGPSKDFHGFDSSKWLFFCWALYHYVVDDVLHTKYYMKKAAICYYWINVDIQKGYPENIVSYCTMETFSLVALLICLFHTIFCMKDIGCHIIVECAANVSCSLQQNVIMKCNKTALHAYIDSDSYHRV